MNRRNALASIGTGLAGVTGGWFVLSGRAATYRVELERQTVDADVPLSVRATLKDATVRPFDPARFTFTIENDGSESLAASSGAPGPFGVLRATGGDGDELTLWSDAYAETQHVTTVAGTVLGGNDIGIETVLEPGDSIAERYELRRRSRGLEPGLYTISGSHGVGAADPEPDEEWSRGSLSYEVEFSLE